jgi:hypothetical protein
MNWFSKLLTLLALTFLLTARQMPAPVHELEEATPAKEESAKREGKTFEAEKRRRLQKIRSEVHAASFRKSEKSGRTETSLSGRSSRPAHQRDGQISSHVRSKHWQSHRRCSESILRLASLDNAAVAAFRQWHEDPQCAKEVTMTMTFQPPPASVEE